MIEENLEIRKRMKTVEEIMLVAVIEVAAEAAVEIAPELQIDPGEMIEREKEMEKQIIRKSQKTKKDLDYHLQ